MAMDGFKEMHSGAEDAIAGDSRRQTRNRDRICIGARYKEGNHKVGYGVPCSNNTI